MGERGSCRLHSAKLRDYHQNSSVEIIVGNGVRLGDERSLGVILWYVFFTRAADL